MIDVFKPIDDPVPYFTSEPLAVSKEQAVVIAEILLGNLVNDPLLFPSMPLSGIVGDEPRTKLQLVAAVLAYAKARGLDDPADNRFILLDPTLKNVFGMGRMSVSEIERALTLHVV